MVRSILVEMTNPYKTRPRIDTLPVKGHFLSSRVLNRTLYRVIVLPLLLSFLGGEQLCSPWAQAR